MDPAAAPVTVPEEVYARLELLAEAAAQCAARIEELDAETRRQDPSVTDTEVKEVVGAAIRDALEQAGLGVYTVELALVGRTQLQVGLSATRPRGRPSSGMQVDLWGMRVEQNNGLEATVVHTAVNRLLAQPDAAMLLSRWRRGLLQDKLRRKFEKLDRELRQAANTELQLVREEATLRGDDQLADTLSALSRGWDGSSAELLAATLRLVPQQS